MGKEGMMKGGGGVFTVRLCLLLQVTRIRIAVNPWRVLNVIERGEGV